MPIPSHRRAAVTAAMAVTAGATFSNCASRALVNLINDSSGSVNEALFFRGDGF